MAVQLSPESKIRIKKFLLNFLLLFLKVFFAFFSFLSKLFLRMGKLLKPFFRFVFYKVIVKIYCRYNSFLSFLGWDRKKRKNIFSFLFNEKTVHVLVVILTMIIVLVNLTQHTSAKNSMEINRKALITKLVSTEFGEARSEELIEEKTKEGEKEKKLKPRRRYIDYGIALEKEVSPVKKQDLQEDLPSREGLSSESAPQKEKNVKREEVLEYTVKEGDTVSTIAAKFGVSVNTILWENDLSAYSLIRPGDELTILPVSGVRYKVKSGESLSYISQKYDVEAEKIAQANDLDDVSRLSIGENLIIPGGEKLESSSADSTKSETSNYNTISAVRNIVKPNTPVTSNKMFWPTQGHTITQYYSWRHHGLDIANKVGTPLYASDAGTVEFVGWNRGYGNNVIINHGGGKKTRYAHLSKFYIKRGQRVSKAQAIGEMGNTGWSTGSHLHFEVIINGRRYNPLNYVK